MAEFGQTIRDESDQVMKKHMLDYLISIVDDANDFSWTLAKASHAVLLCRMEQGEDKNYLDTSAIGRIWCANAQNMFQILSRSCRDNQIFTKNTQRSQNLCLVLIITKVLVYKPNLMRQEGSCISTLCFMLCNQWLYIFTYGNGMQKQKQLSKTSWH